MTEFCCKKSGTILPIVFSLLLCLFIGMIGYYFSDEMNDISNILVSWWFIPLAISLEILFCVMVINEW